MSEDIGEITPVKRGPGRPRKHPLPEPVPAPENEEFKSAESKKAAPSDPNDPLIGQSCDSSWSGIGFSDGSTYRCEDGTIVERMN